MFDVEWAEPKVRHLFFQTPECFSFISCFEFNNVSDQLIVKVWGAISHDQVNARNVISNNIMEVRIMGPSAPI